MPLLKLEFINLEQGNSCLQTQSSFIFNIHHLKRWYTCTSIYFVTMFTSNLPYIMYMYIMSMHVYMHVIIISSFCLMITFVQNITFLLHYNDFPEPLTSRVEVQFLPLFIVLLLLQSYGPLKIEKLLLNLSFQFEFSNPQFASIKCYIINSQCFFTTKHKKIKREFLWRQFFTILELCPCTNGKLLNFLFHSST